MRVGVIGSGDVGKVLARGFHSRKHPSQRNTWDADRNVRESRAVRRNYRNSYGVQVIDIGGIYASRYLEALAMVWIAYAMRTGTRNHAFKLIRG